jgi:hypothetical protein
MNMRIKAKCLRKGRKARSERIVWHAGKSQEKCKRKNWPSRVKWKVKENSKKNEQEEIELGNKEIKNEYKWQEKKKGQETEKTNRSYVEDIK